MSREDFTNTIESIAEQLDRLPDECESAAKKITGLSKAVVRMSKGNAELHQALENLNKSCLELVSSNSTVEVVAEYYEKVKSLA